MGEEMTSKKSFIYYLDWAEELLKYPNDLRLMIDDAIKKYVLYGEEPTEREVTFSIFGIIKKQLDRDSDKWDSIRKKRADAGRKGMAKRWGQTEDNKNNKCYQEITKITVNDNVNVNGNNNIESNKLDSSSTLQVDPPVPKEEKSGKKPTIDYQLLAKFFNETLDKENSTMPRIQRITDRRKSFVDARCREYGKDAIYNVILNAAKSDFLNGRNYKGWKADFDWIFSPNSFPKILEGNYQNRPSNANNQSITTAGDEQFDVQDYVAKKLGNWQPPIAGGDADAPV